MPPLLPVTRPRHRPVRRLTRLAVLLALTSILLATAPPSARAATIRTTTGSCVDGAGVTWHTKVNWGSTYRAAGVTKVAIDYAGWTTPLGTVNTTSTVQSYDGTGKLVRSLARTATLNYLSGTTYDGRNPVNPTSGGARVVITVGRSGARGCSVTHAQANTAAPVVGAVGDLVCPPGSAVTPAVCQQQAVSSSILAAKPAAFLALGDLAYGEGTPDQFAKAYHPSYGRLKSITRPIPGNHEYRTPQAGGYFGYFGSAAGLPSTGYYSFDVGSWHVVALNSEQDISATGAQLAWLKNDLAAHPNPCTLAVLHKPRFSSGDHGDNPAMRPFFDALVAARAELLLSGHDHNYERFSPMTGSGSRSSTGLTQVVVGTGGKSLNGAVSATGNSVVRSQAGHGWLSLTLRPTSADLRYVGVGDNPFADRKTITCQ